MRNHGRRIIAPFCQNAVRRGLQGSGPAGLREEAIELIGKRLPVIRGERRRATGFDAARAQTVHEIAQGEVFADVVGGVELAARIERVAGSLAFAQLRYDHLGEALKNVERTELWEEGALTFVYELIQAGQIDSAVKVVETHIKKKRRHEAALFALIAREEARLGDSRAPKTILRARVAAKLVAVPNDRALALVYVARAQRVMGDRVGSEETIREALDTALKAPRDGHGCSEHHCHGAGGERRSRWQCEDLPADGG